MLISFTSYSASSLSRLTVSLTNLVSIAVISFVCGSFKPDIKHHFCDGPKLREALAKFNSASSAAMMVDMGSPLSVLS